MEITKASTYREQCIVAEAAVFRGKFEEFDLNLLGKLPEEIEQYILDYLPLEQVRKHLINQKYYNKCYTALQAFTIKEINAHFHGEDYFGISLHKNTTITNYIKYNLKQSSKLRSYMTSQVHLIDDESYKNMKKIIICSNVRSTVIRMKQRCR